MRRPQFAFCGALLLACLPGGVGAAESAGLFSSDREAVPPRPAIRDLRVEAPAFGDGLRTGVPASQGAFPPSKLRSRVAEIDLGQLRDVRRSTERRRSAPLALNLFADAQFDAVFERSAPTASGYTLTGRLADDPLGTVVLAVNGEWVAGTVWSRQGRYAVRPLGGGVAEVRQLDPSALGRCGVGADSAEGSTGLASPQAGPPAFRRSPGGSASAKSASLSEALPPDDGSLIDLLVVYPPFARRSAGGHLAMRALIDGDVALANEAYRSSGAVQRLNLVGAVELPQRPGDGADRNMFDFIDRLLDGSDGRMDEAHGLRDAYAADLVLAHWGHVAGTGRGLTIGGVGGIAIQMTEASGDYAPFAFSAASTLSFAHELGHSMGLRHERADDPANTPFPYSHAYVLRGPSGRLQLQTIMAAIGDPFRGIPRFSNPNLRYPGESGVAIGVPGDEPSDRADGPADAARSLNGTRRVVANFRASASRCRYELSPPNELPASGGKFRIGVRADSGCAWSAWSNDPHVSVPEGSRGAGDGEVAFQVSANGGWEREVSVFVAGEAYLAAQATSRERRAPLPVCDRARPVREAVVAALGKPCEAVAVEDLASIRTLDPASFIFSEPDPEKRRLGPGAFDGLTELVSLDLSAMYLAHLEPGVFDGLVKLAALDLKQNDIRALRSGLFDGAPNLARLDLARNPKLAVLEPGAFDGLANMDELVIRGDPFNPDAARRWGALTELRTGTFSGLFNLRSLSILFQQITRIEPAAFRGLSDLHRLSFQQSPLASVEPGIFEGLANLRSLSFNSLTGLTELPLGLFDGLSSLEILRLRDNAIRKLEPGLFKGLVELEGLTLAGNDLTTLEPGVFDGLGNLEQFILGENELQALEPGVFAGLSKLRWLDLGNNELGEVHPNLFRGLDGLETVDLNGNGLATVDAGLFDGQRDRHGRSRMFRLNLSDNRLTTLDPDLLRGMAGLKYLQLADNRFARLPPGLFEGLRGLLRLDLSGNPGAPFAFRPEFVRLPGRGAGSGRAAELALEVPQGAAFDLRVGLSASGGSLSADETFIRVGQIRGDAVSVRPDGAGPVTVRMASVSDVPGPPCLELSILANSVPCLKGVRTALGAPLVLFGLPNQALGPDGTVRLDLPSAFPNLAEGMTFAVELGDPAVAEAVVVGELLTLAAVEGGATSVTVTATDADGQNATLTFTVTVEQAVSSLWSGWRSMLLNPSPSQDGGS